MKKDVNVSLVQGGKLTKGGWLSIVSFLLVVVIALSVALGIVVKSHKEETSAEEVYAGGGTVVNTDDTEAHGLSFETVEIAPKVLSSSGVAPILAENSYEIHASYNTDVGVKNLRWTWAWKDGSSGKWGNGKDVSTYVDFKVSTDTLTLTASVKQAFGEQIVVTAKNVAAPDVTKSATFDYAKRVKGVTVSLTGKGGTISYSSGSSANQTYRNALVSGQSSDKMTVSASYTYTDVYTVEDTFSISSATLSINQTFITKMRTGCSALGVIEGSSRWSAFFTDMSMVSPQGIISGGPDLTCIDSLASFLDNHKDDVILCFAAFLNSEQDGHDLPVFNLDIRFSGTYSQPFGTGMQVTLSYAADCFGSLATPGSLEFDSTSKVF